MNYRLKYLHLVNVLLSFVYLSSLPLAFSSPLVAQAQTQLLGQADVESLYQLGIQQYKQSQLPEALKSFEQVLVIYRKIGDRKKEGMTLNNMGLIYYTLGKYPQALEFSKQALAIKKEIGDRQGEGSTLNIIGTVYKSLGQYSPALKSYQQALTIVQQIGDREGEANNFNNLGLIYKSLGQYSQALESYQQGLSIVRQIGVPEGEGTIINNIAGIYESLGQYRQALEYYQQALTIVQQIGDREGEAVNLNGISGVYIRLGRYPQALESYQQALTIFQQIGDRRGKAANLNGIGGVYISLGQYSQALQVFEQALAIDKQIGDRETEATTLNNLGSVYNSLGQYPQALKYYQQALTIAKQIGDLEGKGITLTNIGVVYNSLGQYADAEKILLTAIETQESLRPRLTDTQKISIFERQAFTYKLLQQTLVAQNKINAALEISDRARARAFVELLASKQLEKPNTQSKINPLTIQQIQNIAQVQKATLVQYSIIDARFKIQGKEEWHPSKLYIWVVKPTGKIAFEQVDLTKSLDTSLDKLVTISRQSIGVTERGGIIPQAVAGGNQTQRLQKLYEILIKPIVKHLPTDPNARVVFIPQESLFLVPFPALQDEQGKYLIDNHTILTAPAIQVLDLTGKQKVGNGEVLVVGNPTMPKIPITNEQLTPLLGAEKEAIQIADLFKTKAFIGSKATKTAIVQKMTQARIIHFATHGLLDDFKGLGVPGAIALAADRKNDGFLTAGEILNMKLKAELVVLSACNTGGGNITGDGVIGLSRSLMTAGVKSVVVSLWSVSDNSTSFLMSEFYRHLQQNSDKAVALRQAMLTTKKNYSNPLDWAAFTLIGEAD